LSNTLRLSKDEKATLDAAASALHGIVQMDPGRFIKHRRSPPSYTDCRVLAFGQIRPAVVVTDDLAMHELLKKMLTAKLIDSDLVRDSISLSTVHFVGFACRTFVLSALRLRVHDGSGNGMRSMRHWSPIDSMAAVICRRRGRRSNTPHFSRFSGNQRTRDAGRALGHRLQPMITGGAARAAPPVISRSSRTRSPPAAG
jgi:hypothetical protein